MSNAIHLASVVMPHTSTLAVDDGIAMRIGRTCELYHAQYDATVLPYAGIKMARKFGSTILA